MIENKFIKKNIKAIRKDRLKMTQTEMAALLNISVSALSAYERGNMAPPIDVLVKLAEISNVSIDWICGMSNSTYHISPVQEQTENTIYVTFLNSLLALQNTDIPDTDIEISITEDDDTGSFTCTSKNMDIISILKEIKEKQEMLNSKIISSEMYDVWMNHISEKLSNK